MNDKGGVSSLDYYDWHSNYSFQFKFPWQKQREEHRTRGRFILSYAGMGDGQIVLNEISVLWAVHDVAYWRVVGLLNNGICSYCSDDYSLSSKFSHVGSVVVSDCGCYRLPDTTISLDIIS